MVDAVEKYFDNNTDHKSKNSSALTHTNVENNQDTVQFEKEIDASFFFGTKQKPWQLIKPPNLEILLIPSCRVEE